MKLLLLLFVGIFLVNRAYGNLFENNKYKIAEIKSDLKKRSFPKVTQWDLESENEYYSNINGLLKLESNEQAIEFNFFESKVPFNLQSGLDDHLHPIIYFFPGINGKRYMDSYVAKYFSQKGIHVVISHYRNEVDEQNPFKVRQTILENIEVGVGLIDYFESLPSVDTKKMALLAYSFGGIRASFLACVESRISAYNFIVTGGDFSKILVDSQLKNIIELNTKHKKILGLDSDEAYLSYLKNAVPFEPNEFFKDKQDYSNFYLILSTKDKIVPANHQLNFSESLKGSKIDVYSKLGHIGTIIDHIARNLNKTLSFFTGIWNKK